jgi:hypothetical protein
MKSSLHQLIPFLPLFCNCQISSTPLLPSSRQAGVSKLDSTRLWLLKWTTLHGPRRKHSLSIVGKDCSQQVNCFLRIRCSGNMFTESLPSNERLFWLHYFGFRASCHNIINLCPNVGLISPDLFFNKSCQYNKYQLPIKEKDEDDKIIH